jgi:hypothetical protein
LLLLIFLASVKSRDPAALSLMRRNYLFVVLVAGSPYSLESNLVEPSRLLFPAVLS